MRHETGAYLDPWHDRLKDAYVATMADLGAPIRRTSTNATSWPRWSTTRRMTPL